MRARTFLLGTAFAVGMLGCSENAPREAGDLFFGASYLLDDDFRATASSGAKIKSLAPLLSDKSLITSQLAKVLAPDGAASDYFGLVLAISGDILVVGARERGDLGAASGAAYVFQRNQGGADNWGFVKKLLASDGAAGDKFGNYVAVSKDTILVAAYLDDEGAADAGSAFVFYRNQGGTDSWGEVKKLVAPDGAASDQFGRSISIDGDIVVVGARLDDDLGANSGSAYVFSRNQGGPDNWGLVKKLLASDGAAGDSFGYPVPVSGDIIVVGADYNDQVATDAGAAYVFYRNQGGPDNWGEVKKLVAPDGADSDYFAMSGSISGDTVVIGAYADDDAVLGADAGSAYIFSKNQGGPDNWGLVKKLTASDGSVSALFGYYTASEGDRVIVGAYQQNGSMGEAYIFERNQGGPDNWGETAKLLAADGATGDRFGISVTISGHLMAVGSYLDDDMGVDSGSAYLFAQRGVYWKQVAKPIAQDGEYYDRFGVRVAADGDIMVSGAPYDWDLGPYVGSAFVFYRNQGGADNWGQVKKLLPSGPGQNDHFFAVSIRGDKVVVGARQDNGAGGLGYACVFYRNLGGPDNWGEVKKLWASNGIADDRFGASTALDGDTLVVGGYGGDGVTANTGTAYIFSRNYGGLDNWGEVKELMAQDGAAGDQFGGMVSISGDTVAVGAMLSDVQGVDSGAVYIFDRNAGGAENWGLVGKIIASDGAAGNNFGISVSTDGNILAVGAGLGDGLVTDSGAVYLFYRNQGGADNWGEVKKIWAADGAASDNFGYSVSIQGDFLAVGAVYDDDLGAESGSIYVFSRNQGGMDNWGQMTKLLPQDGASNDRFGGSVAAFGDWVVVGASRNTGANVESGSSYVFQVMACLSDAECPFCQQCNQTSHLCELQPSGVDAKDQCPTGPCLPGVCDGNGSCQLLPTDTPCDDGNFCNGSDSCDSNATCLNHSGDPCAGGSQCNQICNEIVDSCFDPPGIPCDNGNFCDGIDTCNGSGVCGNHSGAPCIGNPQCQQTCDEASDRCQDPDGTPCDDGVACTTSDQCSTGACQGAPDNNLCDDGVGCTSDWCDAISGCLHQTIDGVCDDGIACTTEVCDALLGCLVTAHDDQCDDGISCTTKYCDPSLGCQVIPHDDRCDDTVACTQDRCVLNDGCENQPQDDLCNDNIDCTLDVCTLAYGCLYAPQDDRCADDGLFCNGGESCSVHSGCVHGGDPCLARHLVCNENIDGCQACTADSQCDDQVPCTEDRCDLAYGVCTQTANDALCPDDGLYCNGVERCNSKLGCVSTGNPCLEQRLTCNEDSDECLHCILDSDCDDGVFCNGMERCLPEGLCAAENAPCDDQDPCTLDTCSEVDQLCEYSPNPDCEGAPRINCTANNRATVGLPYLFDQDGRMEAQGSKPLLWSKAAGPESLFVDGGSGLVQWIPTSEGTAHIEVMAYNTKGTDRCSFDVMVQQTSAGVPQVLIGIDPQEGLAPLRVVLDGSGSAAPQGSSILSYRWELGDGSVWKYGGSVEHEYQLPGSYGVELLVADSDGSTGRADGVVKVLSQEGHKPPVARIVASQTEGVGEVTVHFSCACLEGNAPIAAYAWDFADGSGSDLGELDHTFSTGRFRVRLTVVDENGLAGLDGEEIVVRPEGEFKFPPLCQAGAAPTCGVVPFDATFEGLYGDLDGLVTSWGWKFSDDSFSNSAKTTKRYEVPGVYNAVFSVSDNDGLSCQQGVEVLASTTPGRMPPKILSLPTQAATCGVPFQYDQDSRPSARGDRPIYWKLGKEIGGQILGKPEGMEIDAQTGAITWTPGQSQVGVQAVSLIVSNDQGADIQDFKIEVACAETSNDGCGCGASASGYPLLLVLLGSLWMMRPYRARKILIHRQR